MTETVSDFQSKYHVENMSAEQAERIALTLRGKKDFALPRLQAWNYSPCIEHIDGWVDDGFDDDGKPCKVMVYDRPNPKCQNCGIQFRKHQRVGVAWLYYAKRGLLADTMGMGKTSCAGGLVAMLLETGEVPRKGRVIITPRAPALHQWARELIRMMPNLNVAVADGDIAARGRLYAQHWDVLLIGPEMLRNDHEALKRYDIAAFITDDVDQLRHGETITSEVLDGMGRHAGRFYIMSGTPLQKRLPELYDVLDAIGGEKAFGSKNLFLQRYVRTAEVTEQKVTGASTYKDVKKTKIIGYKRIPEMKRRMAPLFLRRTPDILDDVTMPLVNPEDVLLDMYPAQWARYRDLQRDVVKLRREENEEIRRVTALSKISYGAAICAGIGTLDGPEADGPGMSVKLDWVMDKVDEGDLGDEKVVIFADRQDTVRSLQNRLAAADIKYVTVWGQERDKRKRAEAQARFWLPESDKDSARIFIGTRAIEQSLNLQIARHLVNVDTIMNQARMEQLAGRVRRIGSTYQSVFVHNLLTVNTQEERIMPLLEREAALAGAVWDQQSDLFKALEPWALLDLIGGAAT